MVRFSNSSLTKTQYLVRGITPVEASTTSIVLPIYTAYTVAHIVPPVSDAVSKKTACGVTSTGYSVARSAGFPQPNVDLGLLYSNGYRYQYLDYLAGTTGCSIEVPDRVVTVQIQTDSGPMYVDQVISGYTLIDAYVSNNAVVPQLPSINVVTNTAPPPSILPPLPTNNNNC
jgi:hypothetical protein